MRRGLSPNLQIDAAVDGAHRLRHRRLARRVASSSDELHPAARRCELLAQRIELPAGELPVSLRRGLAKLVGHDASAAVLEEMREPLNRRCACGGVERSVIPEAKSEQRKAADALQQPKRRVVAIRSRATVAARPKPGVS